MKTTKIILLAMLISFGLNTMAQVAINNDGSSPDASAMLDVKSTTKGFLPPRMTQVERDGILNPVAGLIIYQTDDIAGLYLFNGSTWVATTETISNFREGFSSSTTWVCPAGVTQVTVQLWGGAGGGGGSDFAGHVGNYYYGCYITTYVYTSGSGGSGGSGGYNKQTVTVTPEVSYNLTIGNGGVSGFRGYYTSVMSHAQSGGNGGTSSFHSLLSASGGDGGTPGYSNAAPSCSDGQDGQNGTIINYSIDIVPVQGTTSERSYTPVGYVTNYVYVSPSASSGSGGPSIQTSVSIPYRSGNDGETGEAGFCIISY